MLQAPIKPRVAEVNRCMRSLFESTQVCCFRLLRILGFLLTGGSHLVPEYRSTWIIDSLRKTDFSRLERTGETYVDYMGGSLYPESLVKVHSDFLNNAILGNTHSVSNRYAPSNVHAWVRYLTSPLSSKLSADCANEARQAVLSFFQAPPDYTVIFTGNATGALKLVGESYPFTGGSTFVLAEDSHNSVRVGLAPGPCALIHASFRSMVSESLPPTKALDSFISHRRPTVVLMLLLLK